MRDFVWFQRNLRERISPGEPGSLHRFESIQPMYNNYNFLKPIGLGKPIHLLITMRENYENLFSTMQEFNYIKGMRFLNLNIILSWLPTEAQVN